MPRVGQAHLDARRAQVLVAARECFVREGFQATTVHDICRQGGFSIGLLYRYFASKDELVSALVTDAVDRERALLDRVAVAPGAVAAFQTLGAGMMGSGEPLSSATNPHFALQYWAEIARNDELRAATAALRERYLQVIADVVERGQEQGEIAPHVRAEAVARVFIALGQGLLVQMTWGPRFDLADCAEVIRSLVMGNFLEPPSRASPTGGIHPVRYQRSPQRGRTRTEER